VKRKILITCIVLSALSFTSHAASKTATKNEFTIRKDSIILPRPDTTLNQQIIVFPNPFIIFPKGS